MTLYTDGYAINLNYTDRNGRRRQETVYGVSGGEVSTAVAEARDYMTAKGYTPDEWNLTFNPELSSVELRVVHSIIHTVEGTGSLEDLV